MAAQTIVSEKYGTTKGDVKLETTDYDEIKNLAEVPGTIEAGSIVIEAVTGSEYKGAVTQLTYTSGKYTCYYYDKTYNWKAKA